MKLKDIYRPDAVTIDLDDDLAAAARRMELWQVGALAVVDEPGRLVGIFTERDLVRATARAAAHPASVRVSAHASFGPETADVEEDSRDVARRMLERGVRHLPVTAGDELVGMVSMRDLLAVEAWM
jgi:CBS domain-containing protein